MWYVDNYKQDFGSASGSLILWSYEPYEKSCLVLLRISWGFGSQQTPGLPGFCWSVDTVFYLGIKLGYFSLHKITLIGLECFPAKLSGPSFDQIRLSLGLASHPHVSRCDLKFWCSCRSREPCPSPPHHLGRVTGQLALATAVMEHWALLTTILQPHFFF